MTHPFAKSTVFARLRSVATWPCALLLAFALVLGGLHAAPAPMPQGGNAIVAASVDAHCVGHAASPEPSNDLPGGAGCCGSACACAFTHAIAPLSAALTRNAYEPARPMVDASPALRVRAAIPLLRPPIA